MSTCAGSLTIRRRTNGLGRGLHRPPANPWGTAGSPNRQKIGKGFPPHIQASNKTQFSMPDPDLWPRKSNAPSPPNRTTGTSHETATLESDWSLTFQPRAGNGSAKAIALHPASHQENPGARQNNDTSFGRRRIPQLGRYRTSASTPPARSAHDPHAPKVRQSINPAPQR